MSVVAFDLDGCLVESRLAIVPSMRLAWGAHGLPEIDEAAYHALIGPPLESGVRELLASLGEDTALAGSIVHAYRADYRQHMLERTPLVPGVADVVRGVDQACVVTSKPAELATEIVRHLGLLDALEFVEGPSLHLEAETKVETLGRALGRMPAIEVMVGDRHHDIDAGRAHGVRTVGVLWGMGSADELATAGADVIVATPEELAEVLR